MIQIVKNMRMPEECHECPFQLRFKDGEVEDGYYMRRCVIENRIIEYPRPGWCPIKPVKEQKAVLAHDPGAICTNCKHPLYQEDHPHYCGNCGKAVIWE